MLYWSDIDIVERNRLIPYDEDLWHEKVILPREMLLLDSPDVQVSMFRRLNISGL